MQKIVFLILAIGLPICVIPQNIAAQGQTGFTFAALTRTQ